MFGLYCHIPFCLRKCAYCDFFSLPAPSAGQLAAYPGQLLQQLELSGNAWPGPLTTIFFGGGTPSLLPAAAIARILTAAEQRFGFAPDIEISLEANPGTVTGSQLQGLRAAGVNRLSLGAQATDDAALAGLGRLHRHAETVAAVAAARAAGFSNLSLDLIYARPGENRATLHRDLDRILALEPQHLSCYALTVEEGTPLATAHASGAVALPDEDAEAEQYRALHDRLTRAGFLHYEISNFARPGYACRHNLGYWQRQPYLGLGPGAHSFLDQGWGERRCVPPDVEYFAARLAAGGDPDESLEVFDRTGAMVETLYLGLRTADGVSETAFQQRFAVGVAEAFPAAVARCGERLHLQDGYWRFDLDGWLLYDHLISHFL